MKQKDSIFRFKRFEVSHSKSALKVGVDGVLTGLWCNDKMQIENPEILDVGCGCGIISLICAQRFPTAHITGIDIDLPSVNEAFLNFRNSPWEDRLNALFGDFAEYVKELKKDLKDLYPKRFDLIISNPPFYDSGVDPVTSREIARHAGRLSPQSIIITSKELLNRNGRICMIIPADYENEILTTAYNEGYLLSRLCRVKGHKSVKPKRVLIELINHGSDEKKLSSTDIIEFSETDNRNENFLGDGITAEELILEESRGCPTEEYRRLGKEFYLKF